MSQLNQLLDHLTRQLDNTVRTVTGIGNMPRNPMVILYMGNRAYEAKEKVNNVFRQVWKKRAEGILNLKVDQNDFFDQEDKLDLQDFWKEIDLLSEREECYQNMNDYFITMIFDVRDYKDLQSFEDSYKKINMIQEYIGTSLLFTMNIVMLDESAAGKNGITNSVKEYLKRILEENRNPYHSTVVLSNRLNSGTLLGEKRIHENYRLIGNILLLANGVGAGYSAPINEIFPMSNDQTYYITASYSRIKRPNQKICESILYKVLEKLEEKQKQGQKLSREELINKLGISGGKLKFISEYFQNEIKNNLPDMELLEYFPRSTRNTNVMAQQPFEVFEKETLGVTKIFYEKEIVEKIDEKLGAFRQALRKYLFKTIKAGEAVASLTDQMIQDLISQLNMMEPQTNVATVRYIEQKSEYDFLQKVNPILEEELRNLRIKSEEDAKCLSEIIQMFQDEVLIDPTDAGIRNYYEPITIDFLERNNVENVIEKYENIEDRTERILSVLKEIIEQFFSEHSIFKTSLIDEMVLRMGKDPVTIQQTLQEELTKNIDQKMRLCPLVSLNMLYETFIVNQKDETGNNTQFFNYLQDLKKDEINVSFLDSGNSNSIEIVRLYKCNNISLA